LPRRYLILKKRIILVVGAFVALSLFGACSTDSDDEDINGKWTLSSVNGASAASLGINMTLTVVDSAAYTKTGSWFGFPISETGTVTAISDTSYTFTSSGGSTANYTIDGDKLTGNDDDDVLVFKK
jgi:hypothetical protein